MEEEKNVCPICGGTFWILENNKAKRCSCFEKYLKDLRFKNSNIPRAFRNKRLDNFKPISPSQGEALSISRRFVEDFESGYMDRGLIFVGNVGVGKTHLAVAILNNLIEKGFKGFFINFIHLIEKIKFTYSDSNFNFSEPQVFEKIKNSHIVVIDELGAATPSEFVFNKMYDIINYCFSEGISIIFTTNYSLKNKLKGGKSRRFDSPSYVKDLFSLEERISERLTSRVVGKCKVVYINGEDYRRKFGVY